MNVAASRSIDLDRRLLSCCELSYALRYDGRREYDPESWAICGLQERIQTHAAGRNEINSAFVGQLAEGTVVCYRGTLAPDDETRPPVERLLDWAQDFDAELIEWVGSTDCHAGFASAVDSLELLDDLPLDKPVIFTGHSKGGAMAQLAAVKYWLRTGQPAIVTTFGSPRIGGLSLAETYKRAPISLLRYENAGDVVPHLPFATAAVAMLAPMVGAVLKHRLDYCNMGMPCFIDTQGKACPIGVDMQAEGVMQIGLHFAKGGFKAIRDAHSILPGDGYWQGLRS